MDRGRKAGLKPPSQAVSKKYPLRVLTKRRNQLRKSVTKKCPDNARCSMQVIKLKKIYPAQLTECNTNRSSSIVVDTVHIAVKVLLAAYPKSGLDRLGASSPLISRLLKPLNLFISSKSHV